MEEGSDEPLPWTANELHHISSSFRCPPVTLDHMCDYFMGDAHSFGIHPSALPMYREGWIVTALAAQDNNRVYIQMIVRAEMKKQIRYYVHVILDSSGNILHSNCECTAGGGNKAKCKHIATCLYGLESLSRTGMMKTEQTCTQVPQQWHVPRKGPATTSPTKAKNITYRVHKYSDQQDPTPQGSSQEQRVEPASVPAERDRLLNLLKNYQVSGKVCNFDRYSPLNFGLDSLP